MSPTILKRQHLWGQKLFISLGVGITIAKAQHVKGNENEDMNIAILLDLERPSTEQLIS